MRRSTTALLLINLLLLVCGCGPKPSNGAKAQIAPVSNPYFSNPSADYVYRTKISIYGNELGGILIAKKISDSAHRVVLTTDFGNTLIDIEVGQTSFKVNSIVAELDRKILLNTLRDDFRLLFREQFWGTDIYLENDKMVYECVEGRNYSRVSTSQGKFESIRQGTRRKDDVNVSFQSENDIFADKIEIQHYNIRLKIEMTRLTQ